MERLRDEYKFKTNKLTGELDNRYQAHHKSADAQIQAMRIKYEIQTEKTEAQL